jgi:phage terminase large subunit-like protein
MGVGAIVDALAERGIEGSDRVVGIAQGWTLNGAIKTTEVKLASGTMVHCGQPLMAWAVGNAKAEPRGNAITITKQTAGSGKIDPLMATFDAVALMSKNPESQGPSVYDDEDAYATLYGKQDTDDAGEAWDPAVIADVRHPMFSEHKRRFEAWQAMQPDEGF